MDNSFRVSITGRYYDIPTSDISESTLETLKELMNENGSIDPRDLLKAFLEASEISNTLQSAITQAHTKIQTTKNTINIS
ncbi:hypothetical protein [Helicobacter mesocricetorum]|uniref:hypothetical protein n=1 Tax=Helicobacter mesocricetorum TaxID=87012 RepID=UPI000CF17481|nr:hypothetical protein [Helicobacter mesocricetorum]